MLPPAPLPARPGPARRRALAVALVALGLLAGACTSGQGALDPPAEPGTVPAPAGGARPGGRLAYGLDAEPDGLNPATSLWTVADREVALAVFDTLAAYDRDRRPQPALAEAITPDATHTTWTIRLRSGVTLHDGRPVTAELVREGLEAFRAAPLTAPLLAPVAEVAAPDDLTVVVTAARPWTTLPHVLTTQVGVVADPAWLRSGAPGAPVGTGPFTLARWDPQRELVVQRNPAYWRRDDRGTPLPYLDEVAFKPIPDDGVRAATLQAGGIDAMTTASPDQIESFTELASDTDLQVVAGLAGQSADSVVLLNTMAAPFDGIGSRMALALATDPDAFAREVHRDLLTPARGPFAPTSPWAAPLPEGDLADRVEGGGVEAVVGGLAAETSAAPFTLLTPPDARSLTAAQLLQDQWADAGVVAHIDVVAEPELRARLTTGAYQAAMWRDVEPADPAAGTATWDPRGAAPLGQPTLALTRLQDPELAALLDAAEATTDLDQRLALYHQAQARLLLDHPALWLTHAPVLVVATDDVADVGASTLPDGTPGLPLPGGALPLTQVWRQA